MRIIKLTPTQFDGDLFINIDHIGDFHTSETDLRHIGKGIATYTRVGVTTHNNGGFKVRETPEQIIELIKQAIEI